MNTDNSDMMKQSSSSAHPPFQFVIGPRREGGALDDLTHLLTTEAKVVDGPHVRELHHFDLAKENEHISTKMTVLLSQSTLPLSERSLYLCVTPALGHRPAGHFRRGRGTRDS